MLYTLYLTAQQLDRAQDLIGDQSQVRLWHVLADYSTGYSTEDRFVLLIDCDPRQYLLMLLL